jgi:hypothetical protein
MFVMIAFAHTHERSTLCILWTTSQIAASQRLITDDELAGAITSRAGTWRFNAVCFCSLVARMG